MHVETLRKHIAEKLEWERESTLDQNLVNDEASQREVGHRARPCPARLKASVHASKETVPPPPAASRSPRSALIQADLLDQAGSRPPKQLPCANCLSEKSRLNPSPDLEEPARVHPPTYPSVLAKKPRT